MKRPLFQQVRQTHTHLLVHLTTHDTGHVGGGVRIGEEVGWVLLDLLDGEAGAGVGAVGQDTGGEGTDHAAHGDLDGVGASVGGLGVGESDTGGTVHALVGLVDVGGGSGGGLVGAGNALEGDVLKKLLVDIEGGKEKELGELTQQMRSISDWMP